MKRQKWFRRMRPYVGRHLLGIGTAAVVVVTLCVGWPVFHGVAQATTIDPLEETLIKEDVIEADLLQSKVTNGMCEDMLAPISEGTPAQKLLTAQNYMQEIKLIERSMREVAADEAASRGPDWYSSSDETLIRFRTIAQTNGTGGDGSPSPSPPDESPPPPADGASPPAAALLSTFAAASPCPSPGGTGGGGGGGGGIEGGGSPSSSPPDESLPPDEPPPYDEYSLHDESSPPPADGASPPAAALLSTFAAASPCPSPGGTGGGGGGGTGGGYGTGGVELSKRQAAAAAIAGEADDASIAERLHQKEEAAINAGASVPEAKASARCSTEVEVSDEELKKIKGMYEIKPQMPEEIRLRKTQQVGLLVSPVTKKRFEEIRRKHGSINEQSTSGIGCVELVDRMKAQLVPLDLEGLAIYGRHPNDVRELSSHRDARWGWDIYARQPGNLELLLDLRYAISREGQEFRLLPESPVYDGVIRVTMLQSGSSEEAKERPWWQRIFGGIFERISRLFGA
jgi:hypothetical protein